MALSTSFRRAKSEPTIALINVVFLMLIFFMIAGSLAPSLDEEITLIDTADLEGRAPPDTAVLREDGSMHLRGQSVTPEQALTASLAGPNGAKMRLVVDRNVPARTLMQRVAALRQAGASSVWLVTERGVQK